MSGVAQAGRSAGAQPGYCPGCFALIEETAERCPACGLDIAAMSTRDFRANLLAALQHPLADVRLRAIISFGWRGEGDTAQPLAECALRHPTDVVEGLQVVESLGGIRDAAARQGALHILVVSHPARAVRLAAQQNLREA